MIREADFSGELTGPCKEGDFTVAVTTVNQGPGSTNMSDATPNGFTCAYAADMDTITIEGKKDDEKQADTFSVKAESIFGDGILGSVLVE